MAVLRLFSRSRQDPEPVAETVRKIKNGDKLLKEEFIQRYKPFIIKAVTKTAGRHVDLDNGEEFSIGLMAFNEAIECYNENRNPSFLNFAQTVIKRRMIDYIRSSLKSSRVYPFTYFNQDEGEDNNSFEEKYLKVEAGTQFDRIETKEEIMLFAGKLREFGITLQDLVESAPKHMDSKRLSIRIARILAENRELSEKLEKKKCIPMVDLMKQIDVNHKTVERNRKFILAVYFILKSQLDILQGYVENVEKGGNNHG